MFKFLKEKIKNAVDKISRKIEEKPDIIEDKPVEPDKQPQKPKKVLEKKEQLKVEEVKEEPVKENVKETKLEIKKEESIQEVKEKKGFFAKISEKFKKEQPKVEEVKEEKKTFFGKLTEKIITKKINSEEFDDLFWDLEVSMLENNVAVEVIEKIKEDLKLKLVNQPIKRGEIEKIILDSLKLSISRILNIKPINLLDEIKNKKPYSICFVGINGSGKTTSIARIAHYLQKNKQSCVIAAADTFRAAAIQQLQEWGKRLNVKVIVHDYGSDAAAVAFDAIKHAEAKHISTVLIDTAGRLHSNKDLMREMEKIIKVAKPDLKIFVGESITGNDCLDQIKEFNDSIGIDAIILTKADIDEKGGTAISASFVTGKPILFLGVGQGVDDLKEFDKEEIMRNLGL